MNLLILVTAGLSICILVLVIYTKKLASSYETMMTSYKHLEELNSVLRMQRHDYLNHLQVVYGLLEVEEYDELKDYLAPVYKDIMKTGKALRTSKPAINALLRAKNAEAENDNIDMYIEVKSDLKAMEVPDWEVCKVLSNIIDNGMTALKNMDGSKKISIDINESKENYIFDISNNGPEIPEEKRAEIFKAGVTSKKEQGHGMGLYIVSSVIKKYKGTIQLKSDKDNTSFIICFPKADK